MQLKKIYGKCTIIYLMTCLYTAIYIFFDNVVMEDLNNLYGPNDRGAVGLMEKVITPACGRTEEKDK